MYLRILKKDLKRKKTMNIILFVFIILAATFIASSVNNMLSVTTALDSYFEKAGVPDYWFVVSDKSEIDRFESFAAEEDYDYTLSKMMQVMPSDVYVEDRKLDMSTTVCLGSFDNSINVFDAKDNQLTGINDGEIYMSADIFYSSNNDINVGDEIKIKVGEQTKTFTLKGYVKDALFGSSMLGISKMMINENDYKSMTNEDSSLYFSAHIYTDDPKLEKYGDCILKGDLDRGVEVLQNVMENSIKYGDGHSIEISFADEENCIIISVKNSGCTLNNTELPHIFDSFWRGSNAPNVAGSGLGLYICRQLMRKMGGEIFAECLGDYIGVSVVFTKA